MESGLTLSLYVYCLLFTVRDVDRVRTLAWSKNIFLPPHYTSKSALTSFSNSVNSEKAKELLEKSAKELHPL